jgi:hypothetical protein
VSATNGNGHESSIALPDDSNINEESAAARLIATISNTSDSNANINADINGLDEVSLSSPREHNHAISMSSSDGVSNSSNSSGEIDEDEEVRMDQTWRMYSLLHSCTRFASPH